MLVTSGILVVPFCSLFSDVVIELYWSRILIQSSKLLHPAVNQLSEIYCPLLVFYLSLQLLIFVA